MLAEANNDESPTVKSQWLYYGNRDTVSVMNFIVVIKSDLTGDI